MTFASDVPESGELGTRDIVAALLTVAHEVGGATSTTLRPSVGDIWRTYESFLGLVMDREDEAQTARLDADMEREERIAQAQARAAERAEALLPKEP